jgi:multisubunit Na+/H+ antiporter MnhB subunit
MRKIMPLLGGWVILSLVAAGLLLLRSWPWRPHSALGWGLLFLAALPLTLLGEYLGDRVILQTPLAARLDALGSGAQASALRIAYVLICVIVVGVAGIYAFALLNSTGWLGAL